MSNYEYYQEILGTCAYCPYSLHCEDIGSNKSCKTESERDAHIKQNAERE